MLARPWAYHQTDVRRPEDLTPVRFCDNVNDLSHKIEVFLEYTPFASQKFLGCCMN